MKPMIARMRSLQRIALLLLLFAFLVLPSCSPEAGASPHTSASNGGMPPSTQGNFSILNGASAQGNSLTILYGTSSEGNRFVTYWRGTDIMKVISMGSSQYEIVESNGNRCVSVAGSSVTMRTCIGDGTQLFTLNAQSDGSYVIQSSGSSCLNASGAFVVVDAQPCSSSSSQHWTFSGASALNLGPSTPAPPVSYVPTGYHLTFDDEFTNLSISDTDGAGTNWYTHTIQCCLSDTSNPSTPATMAGITSPQGQNPFSLVAGGGLDIRLQKTNGHWYSGVLSTVDSKGAGFSQKYGYFEMRANFPAGLGTWPAFWLLNSAALSSHATAGEIDVVESYMFAPTVMNTVLHDWAPPAVTLGYNSANVTDLSQGFHTFGLLWTASTMTFYCDGGLIYQINTPAVMNQAYYPIIDLGLGGGWPTNQTPQRSDMIVQYVRAYSM